MCQCIQLEIIYRFDGVKAYNMSNSKARRSSWGQIVKLWQLFGTPNEETWSGVSKLDGFNEDFPSYPSNLDTFLVETLILKALEKGALRMFLWRLYIYFE